MKFLFRLFFLLFLCSAFPVAAGDDTELFYHEFWCEMDPERIDGSLYPLTNEEASRYILEEAAYVYSAMIYGLSFSYTPSDILHGVDEEYKISLLHQLPEDTLYYTFKDDSIIENRYWVYVRYDLDKYQYSRRSSWLSNILETSTGIGTAEFVEGSSKKLESIHQGIKDAVRNYLRPLMRNKPREVNGEVLLLEVPYIIINEGQYVAKVRIKLRITDITEYQYF